jgi:hypothetical protein
MSRQSYNDFRWKLYARSNGNNKAATAKRRRLMTDRR